MTGATQTAQTPTAALAGIGFERFPDEAAREIETASVDEIVELLGRQSLITVAAVLRRLTPDRAARLVAAFGEDTANLLRALDPNRAANLLSRLDEAERERCLAMLDEPLARELRELAEYPSDSAGGLMDPRITTFRPDATVEDVVSRMRTFRQRRVQDVFAVDPDDHLVGAVSLQAVVLADAGTRLSELMRSPTPSVQATAPRDEVVSELERHRAESLPVVDFDGRVLGVLRQAELVTAAQEAAITDAVTMVGAGKDERALSSPLFAVRKRLPWLQVNLLTAFLAASVVGLFESTIATFTALAVLLPVVAGQSGNTGAQALAVTMRGLALREVRVRHWLRVAGKELLAGIGNGVAVAATTSVAVYFWSSSLGLALVIGISMVISMALAGLSGAIIPMILTALRQDPAQSSSIILTTVTDVAGFFSFLGIATLLSSML
jgi:magnesium transporter